MRFRLGSPRMLWFWMVYLVLQSGMAVERWNRNRVRGRTGHAAFDTVLLCFYAILLPLFLAGVFRNDVELTSSALISRRGMARTRSIPYADIATIRITSSPNSGDYLTRVELNLEKCMADNDGTTRLLILDIREPDAFLAELQQRAPHAVVDDSVARPASIYSL